MSLLDKLKKTDTIVFLAVFVVAISGVMVYLQLTGGPKYRPNGPENIDLPDILYKAQNVPCAITPMSLVVEKSPTFEADCPDIKYLIKAESLFKDFVSLNSPDEMKGYRIVLHGNTIMCDIPDAAGCSNGYAAAVFLRSNVHYWQWRYTHEMGHGLAMRRHQVIDSRHFYDYYPDKAVKHSRK